MVAEYPHDPAAFTQGLLWYDGSLYESTGQYGESTLRRVDLASGRVEQRVDLAAEFFGEGLERVGERLVLLTWKEQVALVFDLASFEEVERRHYLGQGWGLCFDGVDLVRSDGTARLSFHDAKSFSQLRQVEVRLGGRPLANLNELECVDGMVWANVWQTDSLVAFDPDSGEVTTVVDASGLLTEEERADAGVLNGIAHLDGTDRFLLTGKHWPWVFEVRFVPR